MLEKIKRYMEENLLTCLLMLSMILFICFIFYQYGFLDIFNIGDNGLAFFYLLIIFPIVAFIFYFINLLMILVYKGILNRKNILLRLLIAMISIFVLSIIQLIVLVFVWQEKYISNSFISLMIILLPYILMILIQTKSIKYLKNELKTTLLSLLVTIIVYMLINIENGVLMISLYNVIYLLFNNRFEVLKEKKILMLGCIIVGIIYYINKDEIRIGTVAVDEEETSGNTYSDIEEKTGSCYIRINGRKKICGKVEKGKREGKWVEWYENGEKESEGTYINSRKEGKWIEWDTDGKKKAEGNYVNNRKEGKWIYYHKNGRKSSEGIYKNDIINGKYTYWYESGQKRAEGICIDYEKKGKWIEWDRDGNKYEVIYKDGIGEVEERYKNGQRKAEGRYGKFGREGKWLEWYENGEKKVDGNYNEYGNKEGKWLEWYENGRKKIEGNYEIGEMEDSDKGRVDEWKEWYENGEKKVEGNYNEYNQRDGKWIEYYENGKKKSEVTYKDDEEIKRIEYDENGNRIE